MGDFRKTTEIKSPPLPALRALLSLAIGVVVVAALAIAREVFIPITVAILLSFVLAPLVSLLTKIKVPRVVAVLAVAVLAIIFFTILGTVIASQFAGLARNLPRYAAQIETKITTLRQETIGRFPILERTLPAHILPIPDLKKVPEPQAADTAPAAPPPQREADPTAFATSIVLPILGPITETAIIGIVAMFILVQRNDLRDRIIRLCGTRDLHRTTIAMNEAASRLSHYFLAQLAVNTGFGFIIACGLAIIGVPSAILFGILAGILRYVPYVGVVVAAVLPAALAAASSPHWGMMWWTLALVGGVEFLTGQFVEPFVYGNTTGLSPLSIVVATIFWAWLWGPIGLVLATPLTLCLVVLGRYIEHLEFLDVLFGDQPALTPVENFYQRMLARDPDEALHQADILLKQMPLSDYYDEVAVNGLRLAAYDAERGVLHADDVERVRTSVLSLVEDLEDYDEWPPDSLQDPEDASHNSVQHILPAPIDADAPAQIVCVAGRGAFDETVAQIFVQLLRKRNVGAQLAPPGFGATRFQTAGVEGTPNIVCVIYLEIRNNLTAARAMVRRLHHQMPTAQIILGIWSSDNKEEDLLGEPSLDVIHPVRSLREGLDRSVDLIAQAQDGPQQIPEAAGVDKHLTV